MNPDTEIIRSVEVPKKRVSFSRVSKFNVCPLMYYFHYVLGDKEPASITLAFGTSVHSAIESCLFSRKTSQEMLPLSAALDVFIESLRNEIKNNDISLGGENIEDLEKTGIILVSKWHCERASTVVPVQIETPHLISIPGIEEPILLFLDLVEKNHGMFEEANPEHLVVTDFKTSKTAYSLHDANLSLQLALGCIATGTSLCRYDVLNKKKGDFQPVLGVMHLSVCEYLIERFRKTVELINRGIFIPPPPGEWPCTSSCYYWKKCAGKKIPDVVFEATEREKLRKAEEKERKKEETAAKKSRKGTTSPGKTKAA